MNPENEKNLTDVSDAEILCPQCRRRNAPTRLKCLYCGAELALDERQTATLKPRLRKIEAWEKAFNLICIPCAEESPVFDDEKLAEISRMTRLEPDVLRGVFKAAIALPVARAESEREAAIVTERLAEMGVEIIIVSDEDLSSDVPPKRLRGLEFGEDSLKLRLFNAGETIEIPRADLSLVVVGAVFEKRVESVEKRKKDDVKMLDATETASDEILIDLYAKNAPNNFRIEQKGFDFSCLGADKTFLAAENIKVLLEKLKNYAAHAEFSDDYRKIRQFLGDVWEVEHRTDPQGLKRHSFGKFDFTKLATSSNLSQFTKYSRLKNFCKILEG